MNIGRAGLLAWAGLFLALAFSPAQAAPCKLMKYASFPIDMGRVGAVTVPIAVNGTNETFIVDTGGIYSSLTQPTVAALDLKSLRIQSGLEVYAANGAQLDHYVTVDTLGIGAMRARYVHMLVDPGSAATGMNHVQGTLAPDLLRNFDLDFDFGHRTLNLMSPKHCKGQVVYWASRYAVVPFTLADSFHIEVPVTLDGHSFRAIIDTGASRTAIRARTAAHEFALTPKSPGMMPTPGADGNTVVPFHYRFKTLVIGGITVKNPLVGILVDAATRSFWKKHSDWIDHDPVYGYTFKPQPIILGLDVLTKLHLYIAYDEEKLYVTTADAGFAAPAKAASTAPAPDGH